MMQWCGHRNIEIERLSKKQIDVFCECSHANINISQIHTYCQHILGKCFSVENFSTDGAQLTVKVF